MRIVVSANGADLDGPSSPRFGRCPMFLFVDTETLEFEAVPNPGVDASGGAGIQAARLVADSGVEAVITGKVGPNALEVLEAAELPIYLFAGGSVREAVEELRAGRLEALSGVGSNPVPARAAAQGGPQPAGTGSSRRRVAFAADSNRGLDSTVSQHFGRCPHYVLVDLEGHEPRNVASVDNPFYRSHQPGQVPRFIREQGADVIVAGGMGRRALDFFRAEQIEAVTGASGSVGDALDAYLGGRLASSEPCRESTQHQHETEQAQGRGMGGGQGRGMGGGQGRGMGGGQGRGMGGGQGRGMGGGQGRGQGGGRRRS